MRVFLPCSTLDDVILSYITGVLEDLGSQESVEENFDVEVFVEMLEAYIPGFAEIDRWISRPAATGPHFLHKSYWIAI